MYTVITVELLHSVATITLNRPDKLNALNRLLLEELNAAIDAISTNPDCKTLIITGYGEKAFAAGADIRELSESTVHTGVSFSHFGQSVFNKISTLHIPVIAAVNGFALGGGCELALACHMRFASTNARFGQPEVNLGIIPGYGGTQRLTKLVGQAKSFELTLSGELVDANEALRIGLVNRLYPQNELVPKTYEFAQILANKAPLAIRGCIEAINASGFSSIADGQQIEAAIFGRLCGTQDFAEGTKAFIEKRTALFTGH